jgi:carboxyl-terminal processing protease
MPDRRKLLLTLSFLCLLAIGSAPGLARFRSSLADSPKALVDEVWQTVAREYVDGTFNKHDWQQVRRQLLGRQYANKEEAYKAIRLALRELGDPYTRFLSPKEFSELREQTRGELVGIGVSLGVSEKEKLPIVLRTFKQSPAATAGVRTQDRILTVDERPTAGRSLDDVSGRIRGPEGTQVRLGIRRADGERLQLTITRRPVTIPVVEAFLRTDNGRRIGYIQLLEFSEQAAPQIREALDSLGAQGAEGWILDLRGNPGGLVDAAVNVANLFLNGGNIVSVVDRQGLRETVQADRRARTQAPLVVLVDGGTASAGEILAGALQDNRRATLVGTRTFGKGVIQQVNALSDGSGVNVTIARYLTPAGRDINKKGITPDIKAEIPPKVLKTLKVEQVGTAADPQYRRALEALGTHLDRLRPRS